MDVDNLIEKLIQISKPDGKPIFILNNYLWIIILTIGLIIVGKIYNNESLRVLSHVSGLVLIQLAFSFGLAMTLNVMRKEDDMKKLAIWKKALLLSISLVPICGLLLVQINLLSQLMSS